ncbi:MAG TPA: response regulator, partial [Polyangia bacterium]
GSVNVRFGVVRDAPSDGRHWGMLEVIDTGIGIPADKVRDLFQPFTQADRSTTRRFGGSGLGLAICRRLSELMGGSIRVESTLGRGSRFEVRLPFEAVAASALPTPTVLERVSAAEAEASLQPMSGGVPSAPATARPAAAPRAERVLIVEDNGLNLKIALHMCRKLGFDPDVASSGTEALEKTAQGAYDILLLDCQMPDVDGYTVTRQLRARTGAQPVIVALTAAALPGDRERCLAAGMNDYLAKPMTLAALHSLLERWAPRPTQTST